MHETAGSAVLQGFQRFGWLRRTVSRCTPRSAVELRPAGASKHSK